VIFTVGHSTRAQEELIAILKEAGIALLVDVRRFPGSRRHPQFGKERLRAAGARPAAAPRAESRGNDVSGRLPRLPRLESAEGGGRFRPGPFD